MQLKTTYLANVDICAVRVDIWIICQQGGHVNTGVISNEFAEIARLNDGNVLAILTGDSKTKRLEGHQCTGKKWNKGTCLAGKQVGAISSDEASIDLGQLEAGGRRVSTRK